MSGSHSANDHMQDWSQTSLAPSNVQTRKPDNILFFTTKTQFGTEGKQPSWQSVACIRTTLYNIHCRLKFTTPHYNSLLDTVPNLRPKLAT